MLRNLFKQFNLARVAQVDYLLKANYSKEIKKNHYGPIHKIDDDLETFDQSDDMMEHPFTRAKKCLTRDFIIMANDYGLMKSDPADLEDYGQYSKNLFPVECDVLIIGGGAMGSSIAYWLQQRIPRDFKIVVVEKDSTYRQSSTALSVGGLRQQFTFEENIEMSLFSAEFLRNANNYLEVPGMPPVNVNFRPYGYLFLSTEKSAQILINNSKRQIQLGARNVILSPEQLKLKFPWINTDGVALGCLGLEKEGWFDPWSLLCGFKRKAMSLGVEYVNAEAKGFIYKDASPYIDVETNECLHKALDKLVVEMPNGQRRAIKFAIVIVACGASSARIARMAGIGVKEGIMSIPLPVEPRKRYVYCFHAPKGPGLNTPLTIDPTGAYFRREGLGGLYVCGQSPDIDEEPSIDNLDVDENFFHEKVWPNLANRVPAFENLKLKSSWAGFYEYNYYDANGIIGCHPAVGNMMFATGFSGHGIQQSPAVGRAIMELIVHSQYMTIDLTRLGFNRFLSLKPMREAAIV